MKKSHAFAALRAAVVADLLNQITTTLVPHFNAEISEIRTRHEAMRPESEALADHKKRAEIADLIIRRDEFINGLNADLKSTLEKRVVDYGGKIREIEIEDIETQKLKKVLEAVFTDESVARFPRKLWIDYKAFDRV